MGGNDTCSFDTETITTGRANQLISLVGTILGWVYLVFILAVFLVKKSRRQENAAKNKRNEELILISTFGVMFSFSLNFRDYFGRSSFPCVLYFSYMPLLFAWGFWPVVVRVVLFYNKISFNRLLAEDTFVSFLETNIEAGAIAEAYNHGEKDENQKLKRVSRGQKNSFTQLFYGSERSQSALENGPKLSDISFEEGSELARSDEFKPLTFTPKVMRAKYHASKRFGLILCVLPSCLLTLTYFALTHDIFGCKGCKGLPLEVFAAGLVIVLCLSAVSIYVFWKVRHEPDPLGIKNEMRKAILIAVVGTTAWFILTVVDINDAQEEKGLVNYWVINIFFYCAMITVMLAPSITETSAKRKLSELSGNMSAILESQIGRQLFKAHMVTELSIENYYFWREATLWKKTYQSTDERSRLLRFRFLVETFLDSDSFLGVNISFDAYNIVLRVLDGVDPLTVTVFDRCIGEVHELMVLNSWPRFQRSELYRAAYANELNESISEKL